MSRGPVLPTSAPPARPARKVGDTKPGLLLSENHHM